MEHFEITAELMEKAITYMPLVQKTLHAEMIARQCLKKVKPLDEKKDSIDAFLIVPSVVGEDNYKKECMMLNVLLSYYFDIELPQMDGKLYDKYMSGHLLNQLERYKTNPEYKTKAFDILTDFKTFKKMVDVEIYNIKAKENDFLERFMKGLSLFSAEQMLNNPEYLKNMAGELKAFIETAKSQGTVAGNAIVEAEE